MLFFQYGKSLFFFWYLLETCSVVVFYYSVCGNPSSYIVFPTWVIYVERYIFYSLIPSLFNFEYMRLKTFLSVSEIP